MECQLTSLKPPPHTAVSSDIQGLEPSSATEKNES